jgi:Family of unknown function (DUF5989)
MRDDAMARIGHGAKLLREIIQFAIANKAYWLIPLVLVLGIAAVVMVTSQGAAPLIYTLF